MTTSRLCARSWPRQSVALATSPRSFSTASASSARLASIERRISSGERCALIGASTFAARADATAVGVAGCGAVSVALISWASSIAICGVGGEPFLKKRAATKPAMPPNRNSDAGHDQVAEPPGWRRATSAISSARKCRK